jgi:hypothetical protein
VPGEQPQQLLSRISGGAGDGDAGGPAAAGARGMFTTLTTFTGLHGCMHRKEYLYTLLSIQSTKIDEYS